MGRLLTCDGITLDTPLIRSALAIPVPVTAEVLRPLLDVRARPIDRCFAALAVPPDVVRLLYSKGQANNLRFVARALCPVLVARARADPPAALRLLVYAAYGKTPAEQAERWDRFVLRAYCETLGKRR